MLPAKSSKLVEIKRFMIERAKMVGAFKTLADSIGSVYKLELPFVFVKRAKNNKPIELKEALEVLGTVDQGYKEYFSTLYSFCIEKNEKETEEGIRSIIEHAYPAIEMYMDIWMIISSLNNKKFLEEFIDLMLRLLTTHKYPADLFIQGNILLSKALIHNHDLMSYKKAYVVLQRLIQLFPSLPLPAKSKYATLTCPVNSEFENLPLPGEYLTLSRNTLRKFSITRFDSKDIKEDSKEMFTIPEETLNNTMNALQKRKNSFYTLEKSFKGVSNKVFLYHSLVASKWINR
jgi:hypothetical protein